MELLDWAYALDAEVRWEWPDGGRWGDWCNTERVIRLRPDLGHAFHEHTSCHPRNEWEADVWAATVLIRRDQWETATRMYDSIGGVATELGVLPKVVSIYHEVITRQLRCQRIA